MWIDTLILGRHTSGGPDHYGVLSTIPAIGIILTGAAIALWFRPFVSLETPPAAEARAAWKAIGSCAATGFAFVMTGLLGSKWYPIIPRLWTGTFVLVAIGWGLIGLSACTAGIDLLRWRTWSYPLRVFGANAIVAFIGSIALGIALSHARWNTGTGIISARVWFTFNIARAFTYPRNASLAWALITLLTWFVVLLVLYRRKIFVRI